MAGKHEAEPRKRCSGNLKPASLALSPGLVRAALGGAIPAGQRVTLLPIEEKADKVGGDQ